MEDCPKSELDYRGSPLTWCNNDFDSTCTCARLDNASAFASWIEMFPSTVVEHVPSTGSDHSIFIPLDSGPSAIYKEAF